MSNVAGTPNFLFNTGNKKLATKSAIQSISVQRDKARLRIRLGKISQRITQVTAPRLAEKPAI